MASTLNLDLQDQDGDTALMVAVFNGRPKVVEQLIENGASLDLQNQYGDTALTIAIQNGSSKIVKQFKMEKSQWETALVAVYNGHVNVLRHF